MSLPHLTKPPRLSEGYTALWTSVLPSFTFGGAFFCLPKLWPEQCPIDKKGHVKCTEKFHGGNALIVPATSTRVHLTAYLAHHRGRKTQWTLHRHKRNREVLDVQTPGTVVSWMPEPFSHSRSQSKQYIPFPLHKFTNKCRLSCCFVCSFCLFSPCTFSFTRTDPSKIRDVSAGCCCFLHEYNQANPHNKLPSDREQAPRNLFFRWNEDERYASVKSHFVIIISCPPKTVFFQNDNDAFSWARRC